MAKRIAIFAPFYTFADSYSLAQVVNAQARAFKRHGVEVEVWAYKAQQPTPLWNTCPSGVEVLTPFSLADYSRSNIEQHVKEITGAVARFKPDAVISHDVLYQSHYATVAEAIANVAAMDSTPWFHWVHSTPVPQKEVAVTNTLPTGHYGVTPSACLVDNLAAYYRVDSSRVFSVPNPVGTSSLALSSTAAAIADSHELPWIDAVMVYGVCVRRAHPKGVAYLLEVFNAVQRHVSAKLVLALANRMSYGDAFKHRLLREDFVVRLHDEYPGWYNGVPHAVLQELQRCASIFVAASRAEAGPLVIAEAVLHNVPILGNSDVATIRAACPPGSPMASMGNMDGVAMNGEAPTRDAPEAVAEKAVELLRTSGRLAARRAANRMSPRSFVDQFSRVVASVTPA